MGRPTVDVVAVLEPSDKWCIFCGVGWTIGLATMRLPLFAGSFGPTIAAGLVGIGADRLSPRSTRDHRH